jgi:hypothetical protein
MYYLAVKSYKSHLLSVSESACFIVVYIIRYSEYCICFDFARMQMYFKSETRELA